ncbi:TBC1 domain family member 5 homolog A-like isoform X1 [Eupeodes corollae]|uniref:TBC1 domain family member 5 homolog A-like isoform X1 n=1 Tax=Eupeodes corollae TaxID=290404 RepID=UPI00249185AE|nr:TBC1 domain family member 5 homolog A-like isoform X1 [Eupeodes corollae]
MQTKINCYFIGLILCSLILAEAEARPQTFNNYPFRPIFSDLDPNDYYTSPNPYTQNYFTIFPQIIDQAVSPLYYLNRGTNGYPSNNGYSSQNNGYSSQNNGYSSPSNGYSSQNNNGYNTYSNSNNGFYNPITGYLTNSNGYSNGYSNSGYTTMRPYLSNPFGIWN